MSHTSSMERFSENFDQEAVTYFIFFVGMHWFQNCNFEKIHWASSEVAKVAEDLKRGSVIFFKKYY